MSSPSSSDSPNAVLARSQAKSAFKTTVEKETQSRPYSSQTSILAKSGGRDTIFYESIEDGTSELIRDWKQENVILQKVSFVLREFYKNNASETMNRSSPNNLAQYDLEVAYANKCLVVSALKQSIIEEEIKLIQQRSLNISAVQIGKPDANVGQGCLALRKITLFAQSSCFSTFMFCVVRHQGKVIESELRNITSRDVSCGRPLQFNIDQQIENLAPNFKVVVQFYLMNLPSGNHVSDHASSKHKAILKQLEKKMKHNKFTDLIMFVKSGKKNGKNVVASNGIFKILNEDHVNTDDVPVASSAFKFFGSITIDRACAATLVPIDQLDYTTTPCKECALLDLELSINYGNREETSESFGVHIESRSLDTDRIAQKQLNFSKFNFSKCLVAIDGNWLKVRTKRSFHELDLGSCLNSEHFNQATICSLPQSICLLFTEPIDYPEDQNSGLNSGDQPSSQHHFVFLTSQTPELLANIFDRIMARVAAIRQWQAPIPPKNNRLPSMVAPPVEQQDDTVKQRKLASYSTLLSKVTVL